MSEREKPQGLIASVVRLFVTSRMSLLLIVFSLAAGAAAIMVTPREEEPQIVVPMADVYVSVPGADAGEVEKLVAAPLERLLWQIDGVEHVYSVSRRDSAMVTVRFFVGQDRERSLIKLHNALNRNLDIVPGVVGGWLVKSVGIDDVPIVMLTLHSARYDDHALRRMAEELVPRLAAVEDVSQVYLRGGRPREVRVELLPEKLAGLDLTPMEVVQVLSRADDSATAGILTGAGHDVRLAVNAFIASAAEAEELVVGVWEDRPVYLRDVARVVDGPAEPETYTRIGFSERFRQETGRFEQTSRPAVTLALAKKRGTNAVDVARDVLAEVEALERSSLPAGVDVSVTRNYGRTAQTKVNDLLLSMFFAVITVVAVLAFTLGWREALIVALAVPVSFSLSLLVNYLLGYTINRVTLFALILSLGLVVDDPITNVDNIQRHILLGRRKAKEATLFAVSEVLPPVIMSTLAIIVSFLPLFFITGMMGPYMAPMAANVPLTVTFSTLCALTIVPWLAYHLLRNLGNDKAAAEAFRESEGAGPAVRRFYEALVSPFLDRRVMRWGLLVALVGLLVVSVSLAAFRFVPLKMLPFDNKNEFQIVIDMDEGTPLEYTDRAVRAFEDYLRTVAEVDEFVTFAGTASPMDFNGLVRHYYLRQGGHVADIRVNLAAKDRRAQQSHQILLRLRNDLTEIGAEYGANVKLVEVPPGPPVLSTVTTEVYGDPEVPYARIVDGVEHVNEIMRAEPFVVDVDNSAEAEREWIDFRLDKEKAGLHGVDTDEVTATLAAALTGAIPATVHQQDERNPLSIRVVLPEPLRVDHAVLGELKVKADDGSLVPLAELGRFLRRPEDQPIYHKDLQRVAYAYAEMAGRAPAEAILDMQQKMERDPMPPGTRADWSGEGEWEITLKVFRDLGIAFAVALLGIYVLLVGETNSFLLPLIIMSAIPLTLLGIMPGFWLLNLVANRPVGGFEDPVFFTATSMIGMIALGGIVIRNAVVLIDFVQNALEEGKDFREAIVQSGAIRLRPIVLTALTTALGAWPITLDPIFSGLAWALIFGLAASTAFTLLVIPVAYYAVYHKRAAPSG